MPDYDITYPPRPPHVCEGCKERIERGDLTEWTDGLGHFWHYACRTETPTQNSTEKP